MTMSDDLDAHDADGFTPLMLACGAPARYERQRFATPAQCEWLLARGVDPTLRDDQGWTALHWAVHSGRLACVSALLEAGAPIDARDHRGRTPLLLAILRTSDRATIVELLLDRGADANACDDLGWTALHAVALVPHDQDLRHTIESLLVDHGARESRDHAGHSPADLSAWRFRRWNEQDPLLPVRESTPDPEVQPLEIEPNLVAPLLRELVPEPSDPAACPEQSWPRRARDPWMILADWLQSHGDPRGELVAASLACTQVGSRKRLRLRAHQRRAAAKAHSLTHFARYRADPPAATEDRWYTQTSIETKLTHGLVTTATIKPRSGDNRDLSDAQKMLRAVSTFLRFEPLLAELRLRPRDVHSWPELIELLSSLPPAPRLRRLALERLPAQLPSFEPLASVFPGLRSVCLIGATKIQSGVVRWPGPAHLQIRHAPAPKRSRGILDLTLELPQLTHLDLGIPPGALDGGLHSEAELAGVAQILDRIRELPHLRLSGWFWPELIAACLGSALIPRLRTLELHSVIDWPCEELNRHAERLRGLARVRVVSQGRSDCEDELTRLRELVPQLVIGHRGRSHRRRRVSPWGILTGQAAR